MQRYSTGQERRVEEKSPGKGKGDETGRKRKRSADDRRGKERRNQRGWEERWCSFMSYLVFKLRR